MTWTPTKLTRTQMEERRREGARLLRRTKMTKAAIARRLAVSRAAVGNWAKALEIGGLGPLNQHPSTGRPGKLSDEQMAELYQVLQRGAQAAGFPTERWTLRRVKQVIDWEYHVSYHLNYIPRLLARLGWSLQQPLARAAERDEARIQVWADADWPRIKKGTPPGAGYRVL
jgi:putative transposase